MKLKQRMAGWLEDQFGVDGNLYSRIKNKVGSSSLQALIEIDGNGITLKDYLKKATDVDTATKTIEDYLRQNSDGENVRVSRAHLDIYKGLQELNPDPSVINAIEQNMHPNSLMEYKLGFFNTMVNEKTLGEHLKSSKTIDEAVGFLNGMSASLDENLTVLRNFNKYLTWKIDASYKDTIPDETRDWTTQVGSLLSQFYEPCDDQNLRQSMEKYMPKIREEMLSAGDINEAYPKLIRIQRELTESGREFDKLIGIISTKREDIGDTYLNLQSAKDQPAEKSGLGRTALNGILNYLRKDTAVEGTIDKVGMVPVTDNQIASEGGNPLENIVKDGNDNQKQPKGNSNKEIKTRGAFAKYGVPIGLTIAVAALAHAGYHYLNDASTIDALTQKANSIGYLFNDAAQVKANSKIALDSAIQSYNTLAQYVKDSSVVHAGQSMWSMTKDMLATLYNKIPTNTEIANYVDEVARATGKLTPGELAAKYGISWPKEGFLKPIIEGGKQVNAHLQHAGDVIDNSPVVQYAVDGAKKTLNSAQETYDNAKAVYDTLSTQLGGIKANIADTTRHMYNHVIGGVGVAAVGTGIAGASYIMGKKNYAPVQPAPESPGAPTGPEGGEKITTEPANIGTVVSGTTDPSSSAEGGPASITGRLYNLNDYRRNTNIGGITNISDAYIGYISQSGRKITARTNKVAERLEKYQPLIFDDTGHLNQTAKQTAEQLGVSTSTVYRDLKLLKEIGTEIVLGNKDKYTPLEMKLVA